MKTKAEFEGSLREALVSKEKYLLASSIANNVGNRFDWIDFIILFGKVATQQAVEGSDIDLIISGRFKLEEYKQREIEISDFIRSAENQEVITAGGDPELKRAADAIDITVVTRELLFGHPNFILQAQAALEHGVILYAKPEIVPGVN